MLLLRYEYYFEGKSIFPRLQVVVSAHSGLIFSNSPNLTYDVNNDVINSSEENWFFDPMTSSLWRHHYDPDNLKLGWVRMNIYMSCFDLSNPCGNLKKCACVVLKNDFPVPLSCESIKPVSPVTMGHASRGWLPSTCVLIPSLLRKMRVGIIE